MPWCELRCSCTIWGMIQRSKAGLASPSHGSASMGMQQGGRTMRLIHFNQIHLEGWVHQHYKPCLAHNSHNTSRQKLPQPLRSWICSDMLLLEEKTTTWSFQSSQLVRNNREREKNPNHHLAPLFSLTQSWEACINYKLILIAKHENLNKHPPWATGAIPGKIFASMGCASCATSKISSQITQGPFTRLYRDTIATPRCWLRLRQVALIFPPSL